MDVQDCIDWCNKKIEEASERADLDSVKAYTELLKQWESKRGD